jgi:hypothetical protein
MYYVLSIAALTRSYRAWRLRALNIRPEAEHVAGE